MAMAKLKRRERKDNFTYEPLRILMVKKKLQMTDLETLAGITAPTRRRLEKDEQVMLDVIATICEALNVEFNDVIRLKTPEEMEEDSSI